ncbi:hypothetical protein SA2016_3104 [Sinomonas atrocyanea]|uniref:Recombinase A n=1 Tax=Sinomonas atrocyanea TaxID=37927 RepID=A0A127A2V1_9MICC|nr:hypothetical protein [Sinomonas atrocyanea]AMM33769.1 hypothetical protein SA2016_3104 [Sinomonas atrocyanea]
MSLALSSDPAAAAAGQLRELQERIHTLQGRRNRQGSHPVLPCLAPLFPAGLRGGAAYSLDTHLSVAMALLAAPSAEGQWCGVAGIPDFGAEAAAGFGIALDRLVLVPDPGADWLATVGALVDVLPLVLVRPPSAARAGEASRLASRLRERSGVLLVLGPWPQSEATLSLTGSSWEGLGRGHGHLARHLVELRANHRGRVRTATVDLASPETLALPVRVPRQGAGSRP